MAVRLYTVPASHPSAAVERALQLKGADYERIELITTLHKPMQRARFGGWSVPAVIFEDGTKVLGSRKIMRALEERYPEPPLFPADDDARARVERAEQWGDEVLQPLARRVTWAAVKRAPQAMRSYLDGAKLPLPEGMAMLGAPLVLRTAVRINGAGDENVRADLMHLNSHLDRADDWIADGVIGGEQANAADLQIGSSIRLMQTLGDLAPQLDGRPVGELARRWFPDYPGFTPALSLPPPWLAAEISA
jgi:glutathione S-transferase